jgi:hypothetical protein
MNYRTFSSIARANIIFTVGLVIDVRRLIGRRTSAPKKTIYNLYKGNPMY